MSDQYKINRLEAVYQGFFDYYKMSLQHSLFPKKSENSISWSQELQREVMSRGNAVAVLLYNFELQQILLVKQIRAGAVVSQRLGYAQNSLPESAWLIEPVAGCIDLQELAEDAVKREAMEEAGVEISQLEFIADYYPSPAACDERILLYAAEFSAAHACEFGGLEAEHEDICVIKLSFAEAKAKLLRNEFNVSTTIMSLQWFFWQKLPQFSTSE